MYTDTQNPNLLAQQVIDRCAVEAIAGHCTQIDVTLCTDGSLLVADDGRGVPVEIDPRENASVLELMLTRLGVAASAFGLAVVNALSSRLDCRVNRGGEEYFIGFRDSELHSKLAVTGSNDTRSTGTTIRFWPDPAFFDSGMFSVPDLRHMLRVKAALCTGLRVTFSNEATGEKDEWFFTDDLRTYLIERLGKSEWLPAEPITGGCHADDAVFDYALTWMLEGQRVVRESYANQVPMPNSGAHVEALRAGVARAVREFSEACDLLPYGIKLAPEDVWEKVGFVLSMNTQNTWVGKARRTAGRLAPSHAARMERFVSDSVSRWLNLHADAAERIVRLALTAARTRLRDGR
jgi:topoisomerase IV subunit B